MGSGRVNSKGSLKTASRVLLSHGSSWAAVERAAVRDHDGVYVIRRDVKAPARDSGGSHNG